MGRFVFRAEYKAMSFKKQGDDSGIFYSTVRIKMIA
jgi:hypothetical protein